MNNLLDQGTTSSSCKHPGGGLGALHVVVDLPPPTPPSDIGTIHSVSTSRSTIHVAHYTQRNSCSTTQSTQHRALAGRAAPAHGATARHKAQERRSTAADREVGGEQLSRAAIANSRQLFCSGLKVAQSCRKFPSASGRRCCGQN